MNGRNEKLSTFLFLAGWGEADRSLLAGDASNRRYQRLAHNVLGKAILMDAPPEKGEDVRPFIKIATHLCGLGLSAPKIFARDTENGFLILEDLGDDLFARVLLANADEEERLYLAATDALIAAQSATPPNGLQTYGPHEMAEAACLATKWYQRYGTPTKEDAGAYLFDMLKPMLETHLADDFVLTQRDYHAENLLWLPDRGDVARVGLLDFQDAMLAHPAYDLASLVKDARRDVGAAARSACIDHYAAQSTQSRTDFEAAFAACSAQRNLRILGVFTRLCVRDGKAHYPDLIPRVWENLMDDITHPIFSKLGTWITENLPEPSQQVIARIKSAHV